MTQPSTYHQFSSQTDDDKGGRWAKNSPIIDATLPGAYPAAAVPNADTGLEPPLGYSIDDHEVVGTPAEVEASLKSLPGVVAPTEIVPFSVVETASGKTPPTDILERL